MNWVRAGAIIAAVGVHIAVMALFLVSSANQSVLNALQSGGGKDDLTVVATVTMQMEESIGPDAESAERQQASAAEQIAAPPKQGEGKNSEPKESKREEAVSAEFPAPAPPAQEKQMPADAARIQPSNPRVQSNAQDEQLAANRNFEARRTEVTSLYNSKIYQALLSHILRPKTLQKGRVLIALTLAPSGQLLAYEVVESSGSEVLDKAAMTSLERAAPFPPLPSELGANAYTLRVPFEYAAK
jgi:periplasmic protein TonB